MKYSFLLLFMLCAHLSFAQNFTGNILDIQNNPIENVTIYNLNTGKHTYTNSKGNFILPNAQINDSVVISRLGFQTQKQILTREMLAQSQLLTIVEASTSLNQIVLTSKVNALSSIAAVDLQLNWNARRSAMLLLVFVLFLVYYGVLCELL